MEMANLKQLHTEADTELGKVKGMISDLQAKADMAINELDQLSNELQTTRVDKEVADKGTLEWVVAREAQLEYINHPRFILGPYMDKLPKDLATQITALPREVGVYLKHADHNAPKMTLAADTTTPAGDDASTLVKKPLLVGWMLANSAMSLRWLIDICFYKNNLETYFY